MKKSLLFIVLTLFYIKIADARLMMLEDFAAKYNFYNTEIQVNKDGTYDSISEYEIEILKEGGRKQFTNHIVVYPEKKVTFEILEAKTILDCNTYNVAKDTIESKSLASSKLSINQLRQVSVPFNKVEIGAKLYIKTKTTFLAPVIENYFEDIIFVGDGYYEQRNINIRSKIPLHYKVNDPYKVLNVEAVEDAANTFPDSFHNIKISLKKPFTNSTINEPTHSGLGRRNTTWLAILPTTNPMASAAIVAGWYSKVIKQKLPPSFQKIVEESKDQVGEKNQISKVVASLQDRMQYLGNVSSIERSLRPRNLVDIDKSQYGDCKDFSVSTIAILRSMGYIAYPLIVFRGNIIDVLSDTQLLFSVYNHVIVKVIAPSGRVYFVDPTNAVSMSDDIFPDIANRQSILLDEKNPQIIHIPESDYNKSQIHVHSALNLDKDAVEVTTRVDMLGRSSIPVVVNNLYYSRKHFIDFLYSALEESYVSQKNRIIEEIPKIVGREVKNYSFKVNYRKKPSYINTNYGKGINLRGVHLIDIENIPEDSIHDLNIGEPHKFHRVTVYNNKEIKNINQLNASIKTPWLSISRNVKVRDRNTEIIDDLVILKSVITKEEIQTKAFKDLQEYMRTYSHSMIILDL